MGCLVPGDRVGSGAGTTDRPADPQFLEHGNELRTVGGLPLGQHEHQRAALPLARDMDLAGLPASGAPEQRGLQAKLAPPPGTSSLFAFWIICGVLSVLFLRAAPFCRAFSASSAAFSRAARASGPRCIPAASW